jgi:polyisoprenyl-teichoic acid--peptidoglycan teichoic acid transferase
MGIEFVEAEVGEILGVKIPYGVRVDFSGFVKAVDLLEGIDVEVERSFDDYAYPVPGKENEMCGLSEKEVEINEEKAKSLNIESGKRKALVDKDENIATVSAKQDQPLVYNDDEVLKYFPCRYEHLKFTKGITHMDGETALKFVRSRHGTGPEGSDFARSKRQQLVLQSVRSKVLSTETLTDPAKIIGLLRTFGDSVEIDIPATLYPKFVDIARKAEVTRSHILDGSIKPVILIHPNEGDYGGAWVLVPPKNDFSVIHNYITDLLAGTDTATRSAQEKR